VGRQLTSPQLHNQEPAFDVPIDDYRAKSKTIRDLQAMCVTIPSLIANISTQSTAD